MAAPYQLTRDGYETQWQTNYLSPFLLIKLLLPILSSTAAKKTPQSPVRIVNVSSDAAFIPITPDLELDNPNLETASGFLAAWYVLPSHFSVVSMEFFSYRWIDFYYFSYSSELELDANTSFSQEALLPLQIGNRPANALPTHPFHARRASHQNLRLAPRFR